MGAVYRHHEGTKLLSLSWKESQRTRAPPQPSGQTVPPTTPSKRQVRQHDPNRGLGGGRVHCGRHRQVSLYSLVQEKMQDAKDKAKGGEEGGRRTEKHQGSPHPHPKGTGSQERKGRQNTPTRKETPLRQKKKTGKHRNQKTHRPKNAGGATP